MTNKIIIDGVDVSGCDCHYNGWSQLYRDNRDMCDKGCDLECKPKENGCYHYTKCLEEQLQAKEQECEELKGLCNGLDTTIDNYTNLIELRNQQLDQLKAENDELKKEIAKATMEICNQCGEKDDYNIPCKQIRDLGYGLQLEIEENDKLKQTLTEIKEIAKPYQRDIDKICGYCRRYDGAHACCMDDLNRYEYRTGTTEACNRFIESERFDINIVANKILQKISEVEDE